MREAWLSFLRLWAIDDCWSLGSIQIINKIIINNNSKLFYILILLYPTNSIKHSPPSGWRIFPACKLGRPSPSSTTLTNNPSENRGRSSLSLSLSPLSRTLRNTLRTSLPNPIVFIFSLKYRLTRLKLLCWLLQSFPPVRAVPRKSFHQDWCRARTRLGSELTWWGWKCTQSHLEPFSEYLRYIFCLSPWQC